ncbi:MAG TPA: HD domain-containing phosphohydrolase [Candidatus Saccharimonadales bacterium]|nr:HD domain-containing phosphohydrolase [Candidatus Saccharimonadales bacterium]
MNHSPTVSSPISNRVLVVDDEELVLNMLSDALQHQDYEVIATTEPAGAVEELRKTPFAVVIADQRMPSMTGLQLLEQARAIQPDTTRILITGVLNLDTVINAINKGEIYRFIVKPWLHEELLVTLRNAIQRYELIQQNARLQTATQAANERLVELNQSLEQQIHLVARQNQQLADLNQSLEQNFLHSLEISMHTMQTFYPMLANQARRVAQLCRSMADVLNLSSNDRRVLEAAALLHDIGLVGVRRSLIRRWQDDPEALNASERAVIEQHPVLGEKLAAFGSGLDKVGTVIRAHHERVDGTGYPDRLAGENIPALAQFLTVAVAFASSKLTREDAVEEIRMQANTAFEPDAIRVFLRALHFAEMPRKETQLLVSELRPGMVLARSIYAANGLLLAPEGQQLNLSSIEKLLNHDQIHPISQSLVVYC